MRDSTRNQGRIFRKPTAGGLVLLLVLSGLPVPASAEGKIQHWSKVQEVTPGTEIKVELYKDQVHRGRRKIQGRFHSATDDSITLKRKDGQTQTLQRSAVRKVHTRRRGYSKRWFPLWPVVAERKIKPDWSKVRTVTPGTEIKLGLYKDQVHRGRRKIQGRFHSATDDSITLTLKDGQTHTLQRSAVRKVHTRRGKGWFPLGGYLMVQGTVSNTWNPNHGGALQGPGPSWKPEDRGPLPLSHGRFHYVEAQGWTEAYPAEVGRAQGFGLSPVRKTNPGVDHCWG